MTLKGRLIGLVALLSTGLLAATWYLFVWFPAQAIVLQEDKVWTVKPGSGFNQICRQLAREDVIARCGPLKWYSKFHPKLRQVKAGSYLVKAGSDHLMLMVLLSSGVEHQYPVTFVEGDTLKQILAKLGALENLDQDIGDPATLAKRLGSRHDNIEGLLYPETYYYPAGSSSFELVKRAYRQMQDKLDAAWQTRQSGFAL